MVWALLKAFVRYSPGSGMILLLGSNYSTEKPLKARVFNKGFKAAWLRRVLFTHQLYFLLLPPQFTNLALCLPSHAIESLQSRIVHALLHRFLLSVSSIDVQCSNPTVLAKSNKRIQSS